MTSSDFSTDPQDLIPVCIECHKRDQVRPLEDHPKFRWECTRCDLFFVGTKAEYDRHNAAKNLAWAEREHPSDDWEPGASR